MQRLEEIFFDYLKNIWGKCFIVVRFYKIRFNNLGTGWQLRKFLTPQWKGTCSVGWKTNSRLVMSTLSKIWHCFWRQKISVLRQEEPSTLRFWEWRVLKRVFWPCTLTDLCQSLRESGRIIRTKRALSKLTSMQMPHSRRSQKGYLKKNREISSCWHFTSNLRKRWDAIMYRSENRIHVYLALQTMLHFLSLEFPYHEFPNVQKDNRNLPGSISLFHFQIAPVCENWFTNDRLRGCNWKRSLTEWPRHRTSQMFLPFCEGKCKEEFLEPYL